VIKLSISELSCFLSCDQAFHKGAHLFPASCDHAFQLGAHLFPVSRDPVTEREEEPLIPGVLRSKSGQRKTAFAGFKMSIRAPVASLNTQVLSSSLLLRRMVYANYSKWIPKYKARVRKRLWVLARKASSVEGQGILSTGPGQALKASSVQVQGKHVRHPQYRSRASM